jgi:hypothetical protein
VATSKTKNDQPNPDDKKVFDVTKPGETPASPTSRPIIVSHASMIANDPMVVEEKKPEPEEPNMTVKKTGMTIQPLGEQKESAPPEESTRPAENTQDSAADVGSTESADTAKSDGTPNESEAAAVDALASEAANKPSNKEAEIERQQRERIQKLIDSKQYNVRIRTPAAKRNLRWLLLFLVIIAGAGAYFLVGPGKTRLESL